MDCRHRSSSAGRSRVGTMIVSSTFRPPAYLSPPQRPNDRQYTTVQVEGRACGAFDAGSWGTRVLARFESSLRSPRCPGSRAMLPALARGREDGGLTLMA